MRQLRRYLPPLFTLLLISLGAAMPWLVSWVQDARISKLQEKLELNAVNLTLQKDAGVGPALRVVSGEYTAIPWEDETQLSEREAVDAAVQALERMNQYERLTNEEACSLMEEDIAWAEPFLMIAEDGSTALVWECYWRASPCVVAVDDASGKAVQFLIDSPMWLEKLEGKEGQDRREQWNQFFWDYYGAELEDVEGLSLRIYEDYTSFNF